METFTAMKTSCLFLVISVVLEALLLTEVSCTKCTPPPPPPPPKPECGSNGLECVSEKPVDEVNLMLCFNYTCPEGEKCYVLGGESCVPGQPCALPETTNTVRMIMRRPICASPDPCRTTVCSPGFKCVNVQYGMAPPYASCQIVNNPCNYLTCPDPGQQCYVKNTKCKSVQTVITPICAAADPCKGVVCRDGFICIVVEDGYYQSFAQCVPTDDICAYTICKPDQSCVVLKRYPPLPVCTAVDGGVPHPPPGNPCDGLVCLDNQKCYYEKVCMKGSSCYLKPSCVPLNPCETIKCGENYFCYVYEENGLPIGRCTPYDDPCAFTVCPPGSMCIILKTYPPQPRCTEPNRDNPCFTEKCPGNTKCEVQWVNGTMQAECVYLRSPCDGLFCPVNEYCFQSNDNCDIIPTVQCGSYKRCEGVRCPQEGQYCQELNSDLALTEGFCVPLIKHPCDYMSCLEVEKCYLYDTDCLSCPLYGTCVAQTNPCQWDPCGLGYRCYNIDSGLFAPQYECVADSDPCEGVGCPEFQRCYTENPNCLLIPSRKEPVCAYPDPCNHIVCPTGTMCTRIQEGNSPPKAQCVPKSDPCYGVECPLFQKCYPRDVVCVRAPCNPVPECAYSDPCMATECAQSYKCVVRQDGNNPPKAECVVDYDAICSGVQCPEYQQCYFQDVVCVREPCPPIGVCSIYNPCMTVRCARGYKCVVTDNGYYPPSANCEPDRELICEGNVCPPDQQCYLQNVTCAAPPCTLVPQCAYTNPCASVYCAIEYICVVVDNGDYAPTPECAFYPVPACGYKICPWYQQCYLMDVHCDKEPCYPEPVCSYPDPCLFAKCGEGYTCVVVEQKPKPPTAYCVQNYDVCFGVNCKPGYSCYVKDAECNDFTCYPVPPTAVCSFPDPCAETVCPEGSQCEVTQLPRNNPPVAKCVQPPSPCDSIVCESYEECYIKDYECNDTVCFNTIPVGVCALPDPCTAALCTTGSVCLAVQIRRNPPKPVCGPLQIYDPCDKIYCDFGLQCYVKDVECDEFGCKAVYPTGECAIPNPCLFTNCIGDTVCITVQTRNNPPVAKCKPPLALCDNVTCAEGEQCYGYSRDFRSNDLTCDRVKPYAICAVSNPCSTTICTADSVCYNVQISDNPPEPMCIQLPNDNLCQGVSCSPNYNCYVKDIDCDEFSCTPIQPEAVCSMGNPCRIVRCAGGPCVVVQERNNPPQASCMPFDPCLNITCLTPGHECFVRDYECSGTTCYRIQPEATCASSSPCTVTLCEVDTFCLTAQVRDNPPVAICTSTNISPCDMVDCQPSDWCYVKDFVCEQYSCELIKPTAVCAPSDPCYGVNCPANTVCVPSQIRRNPPQAYCVPYSQLCNNVHCVEGYKCYYVQVDCKCRPYPPQPICSLANPCAATSCQTGYKCENRQYGVGPPFADCVPLNGLCDGINCTDGQECYLREKYCHCPPCGYETVCSYPDPCILALCSEGYACYPKRVGRLEPVAICYPLDDPCLAYDCVPGQSCTSKTKIACVPDQPCPRPICLGDPTPYLCSLARCGPGYECVVDQSVSPLIAKCVPYSDPCESTICPEGSLCEVVESYPPVGRCQNVTVCNPCSVVLCETGYQCVETGSDPAQAQCIPTCAICPPNTDCIVIDTSPQTIRCNPIPKWLITHSK